MTKISCDRNKSRAGWVNVRGEDAESTKVNKCVAVEGRWGRVVERIVGRGCVHSSERSFTW